MSAYNSVILEGIYLVENLTVPSVDEEQRWFEERKKEGIIYLAATIEGRIAGGASITPRTGKSAHVAAFGIFIKQEYRNLGLGTTLTQELIKTAKKKKFEVIRLVVFGTNKRAFHVYQKCGFKAVGTLTKDIKFTDGSYTNRIQMELLL